MGLLEIIIPLITLAAGVGIGRYVLQQVYKGQEKDFESKKELAEVEARRILKEAEIKAESFRKEKELAAQEKFLSLKARQDDEHNKRMQALIQKENSLKQKEQSIADRIGQSQKRESELAKQADDLNRRSDELNKRSDELTKKNDDLNKLTDSINSKREEIEKEHQTMLAKLEKIANMTAEEAKNQLIDSMKAEARTQAMSYVKDVVEQAKLTANKDARKIVVETIQRTATEHAIENAISVFNIKNDDVKGQIIGREGRNIRALEAATGVEVIVDDTPEAIVLSCFDPLRREIARLALHRLVTDGRIHPARIEEVVTKVRKQLEEEVMEIGERTCIDLGIHGLHPELIRMVGKMRYRSSYGQNLLQHSREVANLCATMASELGLNPKLAKRAGLLHDIGKVPDDNPELPHAILGMQLAEKYKENPIICNAIGAHHDEIEMTDPISAIVQACDAISGARPGARREMAESYMKRLKELETLAQNYKGVEKAFAIQAGRELRVIVESEKVTDDQADILAVDIANKIQTEMQYPGQIKVTVIREKRAVSYAK